MTNLIALPSGTELVGDYRIERVLGAGGFGVTYLADEIALARMVTIKEYFPSDIAARDGGIDAAPRSQDCAGDYRWGLDRFIEEAQTLAKFDHRNIVRVYRYFRANNTGYMVLHFEEGQSLKGWLKGLGRAPRQKELDAIIAPLLDALELIHKSDFLHRDIAPDNIIIRKSGDPVLIDFGSARGEIASATKTVSALVKPGYSPYEQYAETSRQQGPWSDIYALAGTLYHAITGKRPPDAPSRMVKDELVSARDAALSSYRAGFLKAIDRALALNVEARPQSIAAWRGDLLAPDPVRASWLTRTTDRRKNRKREQEEAEPAAAATVAITRPPTATPPPPDAPGPKGGLLDFLEGLRKKPDAEGAPAAPAPIIIAAASTPTPRRCSDGEARCAPAGASIQEEVAVEKADPQGAGARRRQDAGTPASSPSQGQPPQLAAFGVQAARRRRRRQRRRCHAGPLPAVREPRLGGDDRHHHRHDQPRAAASSGAGARHAHGRDRGAPRLDIRCRLYRRRPPHRHHRRRRHDEGLGRDLPQPRAHHRARRRPGDVACPQRCAGAHRPCQRQGGAVGYRPRREDRHRAAQRGEHLGGCLHRRCRPLRRRQPRLENYPVGRAPDGGATASAGWPRECGPVARLFPPAAPARLGQRR